MLDLAICGSDAKDFLGELPYRHLTRVADINRLMEITHHQSVDSIDQIGDITKTAGLRAITENRERLACERLADECRNNAAVVKAHARTVGIENTNDVRVHAMVAVIGHGDGLRKALGFIVNPARPDGVHIAPVILGLRMDKRVAVALGSRGEDEGRAFVLCQTERIVRSERADFQGRNRDAQVIDRAGRAGEMPDIIDLARDVDEVGDVVADEFVVLIPGEMLDVRDIASDEAIDRDDAMPLGEQAVCEVGAQKARTARDDADGL